jgi:hypothetical protein
MSSSSRICSMRSMISPNAKGGSLALAMIHEGYTFRAETVSPLAYTGAATIQSRKPRHWIVVGALSLRRRTQSPAANRRSRCGSVRGCPVVSSHFSPGPAPHVGQRTACTCLRLGFLAFTVVYDAEIRSKKMFNLVQKTRIVVEKSRLHSNARNRDSECNRDCDT